ncbi:MAG TPA: hypothetical protein VFN77_00705 [Acetobacteraceae bacterium]|nr:hypothetical protein [Acetobacteraceae bacterium]
MVSKEDVRIASENWIRWIDVFEHKSSASSNILLTSTDFWRKFLTEYALFRTIRANKNNELREVLKSDSFGISEMLSDETARLFDMKETCLRQKFGTHDGNRAIISALSKVSAFLAPHAFTAWDKYARRGVDAANGTSHNFRIYSDYLDEINSLLHGNLGKKVREACIGNYPTEYSKQNNRFDRRVLDVYLMRLGGRVFQ